MCVRISAISVALLLTVGCRERARDTAKSSAQSNESREAALDVTVWRDEFMAQHFERAMVQLADSLRRATNKPAVLSGFAFGSITIPRPEGPPKLLPLAIRQQEFSRSEFVTLPHASWEAALSQFQKAGWALDQAEWHHERFRPATGTNVAASEFTFGLHGEQSKATNRFQLSGRLVIEWEPVASTNELAKAKRISIRELTLLERTGSSAFNNHLLIAPEPATPKDQVILHPVIITDINGDGHDDIVLPSVNKVALNGGDANFRPGALLPDAHFYGFQAAGAVADFNGDGKPDYLGVADKGPQADMLVLCPGSGTVPFSAAPISAWPLQARQFQRYKLTAANTIAVGDVDGDGDLDVYIAQYRPPYTGGQLPSPYYDANDGYPSYLLLNDGHGIFALANEPALRAKGHRRTLAASLVDVDGDGDLDLVTVNDYSGVDLFYNDGKGHFTDETKRLDNRSLFGMSITCADFDHDGNLDLFATGMNIPTVHRLEALGAGPKEFAELTRHRSAMAYGNRLFIRAADAKNQNMNWVQPAWAGQLAESGWSWGNCAADFDNNGWLDVYVANGHVSGESIADYDSQCWTHDIYMGTSQENRETDRYFSSRLTGLNSGRTSWGGYQHNVLFLDIGTNHYVNVAHLMGVAHEADCRAVVSADLNADGRPDLVITEAIWQGTPNRVRDRLLVHLNQMETTNHWVGVRLTASPGAPVIGTKVMLTTPSQRQISTIVCGDSFQSQQPNAIHFGLGNETVVTELKVTWPGGESTVLRRPRIDQYHVLKR